MESLLHSPTEPTASIRLVIVACQQLDCDALAALCKAHPDFRVVCATSSMKAALVLCRYRQPDAILLDADLIGHDGYQSFSALCADVGDIPVMLLDKEVNEVRLAAIMDAPRVGYYTRSEAFTEIAAAIRRLKNGERAFCPAVAARVHQTPKGWQLRRDPAASPFAMLTPREIDVLRLIALGRTIKDCANELHLSPSTVDNHKTRLMKKLGIHRSLDLARLAIREGLVNV